MASPSILLLVLTCAGLPTAPRDRALDQAVDPITFEGIAPDEPPLEAESEDATPNVAEDDDEEAVGDLLQNEVPDQSGDLSVDVDRWVLHDVLTQGFAETRPWTDQLHSLDGQSAQLPAPASWEERLAEQRLLLRLRGTPEQHREVDATRLAFDIPLANHALVDVYVDYFTGRGRLFFEKWLQRAQRYAPVMQKILADRGLPKDLIYLAMIESGFSAKAYSTAAAAGFWQFIGSTGRVFGLTHNTWIDERRDFIRATEAAASYLGQLYAQTGDWHIAWASYNAGEGRIRRAMDKYGTRDFWHLIEYRKSLAKETMHYVPKIIAAAMVAKDPARYGFEIGPVTDPLLFDEVTVRDATSLQAIASIGGVSVNTLRDLNPALLHDVTPPGQTMMVRVPVGKGEALTMALEGLPRSRRLTYHQHRVRSGDTLSAISRRYNSDIDAIKDFNRLVSTRLKLGQELIVPAVPPQTTRARNPAAPRGKQAGKPRARHVVASGETLWSIARRYGVTVDRIKSQNRRRGNHLTVGEVLEIF